MASEISGTTATEIKPPLTGTVSAKYLAQHHRNGWHNGERIIYFLSEYLVGLEFLNRLPFKK